MNQVTLPADTQPPSDGAEVLTSSTNKKPGRFGTLSRGFDPEKLRIFRDSKRDSVGISAGNLNEIKPKSRSSRTIEKRGSHVFKRHTIDPIFVKQSSINTETANYLNDLANIFEPLCIGLNMGTDMSQKILQMCLEANPTSNAFPKQEAIKSLEKVCNTLNKLVDHQKKLQKVCTVQATLRGWLVRKRLGCLSMPMRQSLLSYHSVYHRILRAERQYTLYLESLMNDYFDPLFQAEARMRRSSSSRKISEEIMQLTTIYSSLEDLHDLHNNLVRELEEIRENKWPFLEGLGVVFIKMAPSLSVYRGFVTNFKKSMDILDQLESEKSTSDLLVNLADDSNSDMPLKMLLSSPLFHIGKLQVELELLAQCRPANSADYNELLEAWSIIRASSNLLQTRLNIGYSNALLWNIQRKITSCTSLVTITGGRKFLREGDFHGARGKKLRAYLLTDLIITASPSSSAVKFKGRIDLDRATITGIEDSDTKFKFKVERAFQIKTANSEVHVFVAKSEHEKNSWVEDIKNQIDYLTSRVFGIDLRTLATREGREETAVPYVVEKCVDHILTHGIDVEGIMRLSGSKPEVESLMSIFESCAVHRSQPEQKEVDLTPHPINVVASVLKQFLSNLPEPPIPFRCYDDFMALQEIIGPRSTHRTGLVGLLKGLQQLVQQLPEFNFRFLRYIIQFSRKISKNWEINRMTPQNMAIVVGPSLLQPKIQTIETNIKIPMVNAMIEAMLVFFEYVFENKSLREDQADLLRLMEQRLSSQGRSKFLHGPGLITPRTEHKSDPNLLSSNDQVEHSSPELEVSVEKETKEKDTPFIPPLFTVDSFVSLKVEDLDRIV
eukprot:TRINITY_DN1627_c0_g1_i2.p1 TRINITY_DN1627_c0_g1~~TRINITY_DN1627_c0_g1_i2.p1  ORF type:complete len:856 (+),score=156.58 TRINITY_DN1627_c0_g1_i2:59-2569(+)